LISILSINSFSLTEEEEFELYKEFKAKKAAEANNKNNDSNQSSNDSQKDVNVIINNSVDSRSSNSKADINAMYYYDEKKKSPGVAAGLSLFVPTLGHAYAGNWTRSLPFLLFEIIGLSIAADSITYEYNNDCYFYGNDYNDYYCSETEIIDEDQYALGIGLVIVARVWEIFDAYDTAESYNNRLKRGLNIYVDVNPNLNLVAGASYNF